MLCFVPTGLFGTGVSIFFCYQHLIPNGIIYLLLLSGLEKSFANLFKNKLKERFILQIVLLNPSKPSSDSKTN